MKLKLIITTTILSITNLTQANDIDMEGLRKTVNQSMSKTEECKEWSRLFDTFVERPMLSPKVQEFRLSEFDTGFEADNVKIKIGQESFKNAVIVFIEKAKETSLILDEASEERNVSDEKRVLIDSTVIEELERAIQGDFNDNDVYYKVLKVVEELERASSLVLETPDYYFKNALVTQEIADAANACQKSLEK